jgi:hypothetical protein
MGKNPVPQCRAAQRFQMPGIAGHHQFLNGRVVKGGVVGDEQHPAGLEPLVQPFEHFPPIVIVTQMMQRLAGQNDVEGIGREGKLAHVGLEGLHTSGICGRHALPGAIEHGLAQIRQHAVQRGNPAEHPQREITGTAANIQQFALRPQVGGGGLPHHVQNQGGIHRRLLAGFQLGEAFDIGVEMLADLFHGGFFIEGQRHGEFNSYLMVVCGSCQTWPAWASKSSAATGPHVPAA